MRFTIHTIAFLLASTQVHAQTARPACLTACFSSSPASSQCDGNETGTALATCTCNTLRGSNLIRCIKQCSTADQAVYAGGVPEACRSELFPGIVASAAGTTTSSTTSASLAVSTAPGTSTTSRSASPNSSSSSVTGGSTGSTAAAGSADGLGVPGLLVAGSFLVALGL